MRKFVLDSATSIAGALIALAVAALVLLILRGAIVSGVASGDEYYDCTPVRTEGTSETAGAGGLMISQDVDDLTDEADLVLRGTVESLQTCRTDGWATIMTFVRIAPGEVYKAERLPESSLTVTVPGGRINDLRMAAGSSPEFTVGEQVVLFLGVADDGTVYPSSDFQGKFTVSGGGRLDRSTADIDGMRDAILRSYGGDVPVQQDPLGDNPAVVESGTAYLPLGRYWYDADIPLRYYINPNSNRPSQLTAQESRLAIIHAFHSWQNIPGSYIAFGPVSDTTRVSNTTCNDGFNDMTWGMSNPNHGSSVLATTYTCFSGAKILDTDVEIDTDHYGTKWRVDGQGACGSNTFDVETVMLHEAGHALGLDHPSNAGCVPCPVMDASYGGVNRTPCTDDSDGAEALYPLAAGSPPAAPGSFSVSGTTAAQVTWGDVANEWGYEVWRANESCATASTGDFVLIDTVQDGTVAFTDTDYGNGLPNGAYCYKARSFNKSGESAFSNAGGVSIGGGGSTSTPSPTASPTPTPTPTPSATPTQTPTPTPSPTPTPTPSSTPTQAPTAAPTNSPTSTPTPTPTSTAQQTGTPPPTDAATPTPGVTQSPPPGPTNTPGPSGTTGPTPTPTATATPEPTPIGQTPSPTPEPQVGDVNCDHEVDTQDVLAILLIGGKGQAPPCAGNGDVNCSGVTTAADALELLRYLAGITSSLPGC